MYSTPNEKMDLSNSNLPSVTIDFNEKSNNVISHKPSVKSYATRVFQESTVGIVSSIFTTHSKYRRFFKVFLSSLCITGFIYHCVTFLNHVFEYPEVMDVYQDRSPTYNMPAYTYCSNNPIKRSVFCSMYPQHCVKPSELFCKKFSSYCGANATLVPKEEYYSRLPYGFRYDWILKLGSDPKLFNVAASRIRRRDGKEKTDEISGPYLRTSGYQEAVKACHSIHSLVESNQQPLQIRRDTSETYDEMFKFYVNETEMMNPRSKPGVYFAVHSPFEVINPLKKGIFLKGGRTYDLHVEMQEEVLLKAPFESNCMDYEELWKETNRTGPRTRRMCLKKCSLEFTLLRFQCVSLANHYPHKERICGQDNLSNRTTERPKIEDAQTLLSMCKKNCRDECRPSKHFCYRIDHQFHSTPLSQHNKVRSSKYTTEYFVQDRVEFFKFEEQHRHIRLEIFLSDDEVKILKHSPKYETVDVISSIGGFMGCWLGIALMDILDVFGSICTIFRYAFRKKINKENKKASVHVI